MCQVCAGARANGSNRRRTYAAIFDSLKLTENPLLIVSPQFALVSLRSYFIFSTKRSTVFCFEGPPENRVCMLGGGIACCLFHSIIWRTIRSFNVLFKTRIFMVHEFKLKNRVIYISYIAFFFTITCNRKLAKRPKLQFSP